MYINDEGLCMYILASLISNFSVFWLDSLLFWHNLRFKTWEGNNASAATDNMVKNETIFSGGILLSWPHGQKGTEISNLVWVHIDGRSEGVESIYKYQYQNEIVFVSCIGTSN